MIAALLDEGREIPEELDVEVPEGGREYYRAFWWLHRRRHYHGMGGDPYAIPATEIESYARAHGLADDLEDTMYLVDVLDQAWLGWAGDRIERRRQREAAKAKALEERNTPKRRKIEVVSS